MKNIDYMNVSKEKPQSPGSFNEYVRLNGLSSEVALGAYSLALDQYRQDLADFHGISLEDLHSGSALYDKTT
jgi:hypothetical protein